MKKLILIFMLLTIATASMCQMKVHGNGNVGIGTTSSITTKLQVSGHVRFSAWTDIIFDWSGKCCSSPVMYPERDWYLQLGKSDKKLGTVYTDMLYCNTYNSFSDRKTQREHTFIRQQS